MAAIVPNFLVMVVMGMAVVGYGISPVFGAAAVLLVILAACRLFWPKMNITGLKPSPLLSAACLFLMVTIVVTAENIENEASHFHMSEAASIGIFTLLSLAGLAAIYLARKKSRWWLEASWLLCMTVGLSFVLSLLPKYLDNLRTGVSTVPSESGFPVEKPFPLVSALMVFYVILFFLAVLILALGIWNRVREKQDKQYDGFFISDLKN